MIFSKLKICMLEYPIWRIILDFDGLQEACQLCAKKMIVAADINIASIPARTNILQITSDLSSEL